MECQQCGAALHAGQKFCGICGAPVQAEQGNQGGSVSFVPSSAVSEPLPSRVTRELPLTETSPPPIDDDEMAFVTGREPTRPYGASNPTSDVPRRPQRAAGALSNDYNQVFTPYFAPPGVEEQSARGSSRVPVIAAALVAALVILGTLAVVAVSLRNSERPIISETDPAPSIGPTLTPLPVDAADLLDRSAEAMAGLETLHYSSGVGFYSPDTPNPGITTTQPLTLTLEGDVRFPDTYTMNTNIDQIGDYIVLGDLTWSRRGGGTQWIDEPSATVQVGPVNPLALAAYTRYYVPGSARLLGSEMSGDVLLHHVRFDVDTERMSSEAGRGAARGMLEQSDITADAWIRDSDSLVQRMGLEVALDEGQGVIIRADFSDYNKQIDIVPPNSEPEGNNTR